MNLFTLAGWDWVIETINYLLLIICDWIYILITWLYKVFTAVAKANLFSRDTFETITSRLYIIMGIAMLFIFAYNIILLIINPDDKKNSGNAMKLVKETIISFLLIILLPTIFNWMYVFQNNVIESNIIGQIFLGSEMGSGKYEFDKTCDFTSLNLADYSPGKKGFWTSLGSGVANAFTLGLYGYFEEEDEEDMADSIYKGLTNVCKSSRDELSDGERGANLIAPVLLATFYRPSFTTYDGCVQMLMNFNGVTVNGIISPLQICSNYFIDYNYARYTGDIEMFTEDQALIQGTTNGTMDFNGIMAMIAGALAVWMFLCYTMEIGVRVGKLGFLQIISPIPVMMRVIPKKKEEVYDKWFKMLISTYIDIFIRLIIIFFSLFAISLVPGVLDTLFSSLSTSSSHWFIKALASVVVILGILKFAQDAPGLIKEFVGNSGAFTLKSPAKQLSENKIAMGGLGMVGGAVSGAVKNRGKGSIIGGAASGAVRGARAGYKSNNFRDLKYNTSAAVDRVVQARDKRDVRQAYNNQPGNHFWSYRANQIKDAWNNWTSGDSFQSLSAKQSSVGKMQKSYDDIIKLVEGKIDELPDVFSFTASDGVKRSYGYYKREADNAIAAHENFNATNYAQEYKKTHKDVSDSEAMNAALREKERLNLAAGAARENARLIKEALADAVIAERGGGKDGFNPKEIEIKGMQSVSVDSEGKAFIKDVIEKGMASAMKEIKGVGDKIDEASSLYERNSAMLRDDTRKDIESHREDIRKNNGALKGELGHISSQISKMSELKKSDKK